MGMDAKTRLEIFKTQELADLFDEMSDEIKKKIVSDGFKKAGKIILSQVKGNLPSATKGAAKFIKVLGMKVPPGELALMVGVKKKGIGFLAHLIEDGTKTRFYKVSKTNKTFRKEKKGTMHATGKMTGHTFFENALETSESQVCSSIYDFIETSFIKLIDKYENKK